RVAPHSSLRCRELFAGQKPAKTTSATVTLRLMHTVAWCLPLPPRGPATHLLLGLSSGTHCRTADAYSQNSVESRPFVFGSRFLSVQVNPSLQFRERLSSACLLS